MLECIKLTFVSISNIMFCIIIMSKGLKGHSLLPLIGFALLISLSCCQIDLNSLTLTNQVLRATSNYTLSFFRYSANALPLGSGLRITFDQTYTGLIPSPICSSPSFESTLNCTFLANILTITNLFTSSNLNSKSFTILVAGVTNPSPAKDYVPVNYFQIINSTGSMIQDGVSGQIVSINPLAAQCSTSMLNAFVFQKGQLTIKYNSSYITGNTNTSYYLKVAIPTYYPDDNTQTLINPTFSSSVVSAEPSASQYVYSVEYVTSLTVTLLMPPSTKPQTQAITVSSYDETSLGTLDSCTISLSDIQPSVFTKAVISQSTVQSYSNIQFDLKLPTPLSQLDQLKLNFSSAFDLSKITASSLAVSGYGSFPLNNYGSLLVITANLTQPVLYAELIFTLPSVGLPFTTNPQNIGISLVIQDTYYRISQNIAYSALAGQLSATVNCLTTQIGTPTSCLFTITTSNSISSNTSVELALPNAFDVGTSSTSCAINGKGLNSLANCSYNAVTNTITAANFNSSSSIIPPLNFTLNISLTISQKVGDYQISITTLSGSQTVDTGKVSLSTVQRVLKSNQFMISCSTSTTFSPANYSITLTTPFDLGYSYDLLLTLPVQPKDGLSPTITNAILQNYQNQTFNLTSNNLLNANYLIQNLNSPISTQPITVTLLISYNGVVQFRASQSIAMNSLKNITTLSILQSNQIVYKQFVATFTISGLATSDNIRISASYSPFYSQNQTLCSTALVSCLESGLVKVSQPSTGSTTFNVTLINKALIGSYLISVTVYDSLNVYGKQSGSYSLASTVANSIAVVASQTNPYLNQTSTYTFNLTFSTPNASLLNCLASSFNDITAQCNLNCGTPYFLAGYYSFSLSSTWAIIQFTVTNPLQFNSSTKFTFRTSSQQGDKDYAEYQPQIVCAKTCRSCITPNSSTCTSCYVWSTLSYLYNNTCIGSCPIGTFVSSGVCLGCSTVCIQCTNSATNCSQCVAGYYLLGFSCLSVCPSNSYLEPTTNSCVACTAPCGSCSGNPTNCSSCENSFNNTAYYYLAGQCYSQQCPITYYASLTNNSCFSCPNNCYSCNASSCLSCPSNNFFYNGICYTSCPNGSYTLNSTHCTPCIAPCSSCSSVTVCSACVQSYSLYNGNCLAACPNYFYAKNGLCMACNSPCLLCNATGCISCNNSTYYMSSQSCISSCSAPLHPNNQSMICQSCISPCKDCTWSNTCLTCIQSYSLMNNSCLSACPIPYYSDLASMCQLCPVTCTACSLVNQRPFCSACLNGTYVYSWDCVYQCPVNTSASGSYCVSLNCSDLQGCLSCSGYRCLQCNSLYILNGNYSCTFNINSSAVLSALSQVPVPFPFLIAMLVVIILAFLLKHNYPKMFAPLFIYAIGGILEELCLALWTVLALLWNANIAYPLPLISVVYGTALVMIGYGFLNLLQGIIWKVRIASDRKYKQWEMQDNRCASLSLWFFGLLLSFRLDTLKYSRTAHSQRLSARLTSADKFRHYTVLAIIGIAINGCSILVAAYISYLQSSMNYLFFSCLQVAIMSVLMIVFAIALLCVPKQQLLELKTDYKLGSDQAQLDGTSLQQVLSGMAIVEEEHDFNRQICSESGSAVLAKKQHHYQDLHINSQSSSKLTEQLDIDFKDEQGDKANPQRKRAKGNQQQIIFQHESQEQINHILFDEIQGNQNEAIQANNLYMLSETSPQIIYHKQIAPIVSNPQILTLPPTHSDSQVEGDFQQFQVGYRNNGWLFNRQDGQTVNGNGLSEFQQQKVDELQIMRTLAQRDFGQQKIWRQEQEGGITEDGDDFDGLVGETLILDVQDEEQESTAKAHRLKSRSQKQASVDQEKKRMQAIKQNEEQIQRQIETLLTLQQNCKLVEEQHRGQTQKLIQLQAEERQLQQRINRQQRQLMERKMMEVEDRLTRTAQIVDSLHFTLNTHRSLSKKIEQQEKTYRKSLSVQKEQKAQVQPSIQLKYQNKDEVNLPTQLLPKQIKVKPAPVVQQMYKKKHIFEEKNYQIIQQSQQEVQQSSNNQQQHLQNKIVAQEKKQELSFQPKIAGQKKQQTGKNKKGPKPKPKVQQKEQQGRSSKLQNNKTVKGRVEQQNKQIERALGKIKYSQQQQVLQEQNQSDESQINQQNKDPKAVKISISKPKETYQQHNQAIEAEGEKGEDEFVLQQSQITVFKHEIIKIESSERSLAEFSDDSLWPVEPQLQERIDQIHRKADQYIRQPRSEFQYGFEPGNTPFISSATQSNYHQEDETDNKTIPEILFEECAQPADEIRSAKTKVRTGRVNRRIIDLSPH